MPPHIYMSVDCYQNKKKYTIIYILHKSTTTLLVITNITNNDDTNKLTTVQIYYQPYHYDIFCKFYNGFQFKTKLLWTSALFLLNRNLEIKDRKLKIQGHCAIGTQVCPCVLKRLYSQILKLIPLHYSYNVIIYLKKHIYIYISINYMI